METKQVFDAVANKYDLMNDIMSLGSHRYWKECLIDWLAPQPNMNIVDVAGGTGDISKRFLKRVNGNGMATICDPNANMLDNGSKKRDVFEDCISRSCAFAEELPFKDNTYDAYIVSFGIRNFADIRKGLSEAKRVLKPKGRFMCLEFSKLENNHLAKLYEKYSMLIPKIGKLVVGDEAPYQYLVDTIEKFPSQEKFATMIKEAGFKNVEYRNIFNGVVAIHSGWKE
ncbi:MAG: class I SAM-dependent methyltransferase [Candidatus Pelagibacterales bacterium]|jgi:demethylmenaquinone methyltransferase/2-methoxy-6-polyprenyl-1,4-benzoquinol methylase|tara:strand:- start:1423 stop:2103 length:681 start_codon:yes stop_codon:yes gene_type:complete